MFKEYWAMTPVCDRLRRDPIYMNTTEWQANAWHPSMKGKKLDAVGENPREIEIIGSDDGDFAVDFDD